MSASALPPTAPTTLVILLGASAWPNSPGFQASRAFMHAAQGFREYLLDPHSFGLPTANLLDLFDAASSASDQLEQLGSFLEERTQALKAANQPVCDVLVYFVGHGGFAGPSADFYLIHRRTNASSLRASGMAIDALAEVLREKARQTRRYLFLDCCFAAAAFRSFQGGPDQTAITKTLDAFAIQARSSGYPRKGMVLLCSSDQKSPSLLLPDESCTMFSHALLDVLRNGDLHRPLQLSLRDLKELAEDRLAALPEKNAPRPGLYSPDQSEGDVADVPLFPNVHAEQERRRQVEGQQHRLALKEWTYPIEEQPSPHAATPLQYPVSTSPDRPSPIAAIPSLLPPPLLKRPKRLPSPLVVAVLSLLIVLLLGGGIVGVYDIVTGQFPWNPSNVVWHTQPSHTSEALYDVAWSGMQFVAVGDFGTILTSPDGNVWTPTRQSLPARDYYHPLYRVIWSGSQFVAVGGGTPETAEDLDTPIILTSPTGDAWISPALPTSATSHALFGVAWSGSQFVVVGDHGTILTSFDGKTWTARPSPTSQKLIGVTWSGSLSLFVAVSNGGTILTSPTGDTWTSHTFPASVSSLAFFGVAWSGSLFVVVGGSPYGPGSPIILTSPDGRTWSNPLPIPASVALRDVTCSSSQCVAVGDIGTILTSSDGKVWTVPPSLPASLSNQALRGVVWSGSHFVAVGTEGAILISP